MKVRRRHWKWLVILTGSTSLVGLLGAVLYGQGQLGVEQQVENGLIEYNSPHSVAMGLPTPVPEVTLMVTGDVMLGRAVNAQTVARDDFTWPWERMADTLRTADMVLINLESPLVSRCPIRYTGFLFCGDVRHVAGLQHAGVDVVGFANNHTHNFGRAGVQETIAAVTEAGMKIAGPRMATLVVNDTRFAFLAYDDVGGVGNQERIVQDITQAVKEADVVILLFHWGDEYRHVPTGRQREVARVAIDAGADLVVGNHPHWVQATETYKGTLIMYSHGNFIFDQNWSRKTSQGVVGKYTFQGRRLIGHEFIPVVIEHAAQPRLATPAEKQSIVRDIETASAAF